jgi:hypothetical protein
MPSQKKTAPVKKVPVRAPKKVAAKATPAQPLPKQKKDPVKKTVVKSAVTTKVKVKPKAKAQATGSGIHLLQLTVKGQKSSDASFKAYKPSPGGTGLSELLDALCMAQRDPALQSLGTADARLHPKNWLVRAGFTCGH